jgi:hypothetical protein
MVDRAPQDMAEADELLVLNRVAAFVARKTEAQAELVESQSTMRAMVDRIYAGVPTKMMGSTFHPQQRGS